METHYFLIFSTNDLVALLLFVQFSPVVDIFARMLKIIPFESSVPSLRLLRGHIENYKPIDRIFFDYHEYIHRQVQLFHLIRKKKVRLTLSGIFLFNDHAITKTYTDWFNG